MISRATFYLVIVQAMADATAASLRDPSRPLQAAKNMSGSRPNIIFVLSDDLGFGDVGYSQPNNSSHRMSTPHMQRMADEGMIFVTGYTGPICAPSRTTLMTGRHMGHTTIRGNDGSYSPLTAQDVTVAMTLKEAGYKTALVGKWGLGDFNTTGYPLAQGFDFFVGQTSQVDCHQWYPYIIQNNTNEKCLIAPNQRASFSNCGPGLKDCVWSNDLYANISVDYIQSHAAHAVHAEGAVQPFFMYFSSTTPHAGEIPGSGAEYPVPAPYIDVYRNESWKESNKNFSSAVWAQDIFLGRLLDILDQTGLSKNTLVFFSGDNGPAQDRDFDFDDAAGPFRGFKSSVHEGGVRQQILARWPGMITANSTSEHWFSFWDFLPTAADLAGVVPPAGVDGVSAVPALMGNQQPNTTPIYYEFCWNSPSKDWAYGKGWAQTLRVEDWKLIRLNQNNDSVWLFDLSSDIGEQHNVAAENPTVVTTMLEQLEQQHIPSAQWPAGTDSKPCCGNCFHSNGCGAACPAPPVAVANVQDKGETAEIV